MTDNRKVLESSSEPPSLDRTMPAPEQPAEQGRNLGGATQTTDSAMRGDTKHPAGPADRQGGKQPDSTATKPATPSSKPSDDDAAAEEDARHPEDESALESLGRAIGAPLDGEAADKEPRR